MTDPFDPAVLKARLEEARAQRERALAERRGASGQIDAKAAGLRPVTPPADHASPRKPPTEAPRLRLEATPSVRVAPVAKIEPARPEPLIALPEERPAPPRRTASSRWRLSPTAAFVGGCVAAAAGVWLAPSSLRQEIAEFIAPPQTVPVTTVTPVEPVAEPTEITPGPDALDAPPTVTATVAEDLASGSTVEAPRSTEAPQTPPSVPPPTADAAGPQDSPPLGGPPPAVTVVVPEGLRPPVAPNDPPDAITAAVAADAPPALPAATVPPRGPAPTPVPPVDLPRVAPAPVVAATAPADSPPSSPEPDPSALMPERAPPVSAGAPPAAPPFVLPPARRLPAPNVAAAVAGPARVLVHYPPSASAAAQAAAAAISGTGAAEATVVPVQLTISRTNVRYYHPQDAGTAQAVAAALSGAGAGSPAETRDFTDFRPSPAQGTIEVWLAGAAPVRTASPAQQPAPAPAAPQVRRQDTQTVVLDERERLEREIQSLLLRQLQELQRR